MEKDPTLEFEHFLAQKLGMTVARMQHEMGAGEFVAWGVYYGRLAQNAELANKGGASNG